MAAGHGCVTFQTVPLPAKSLVVKIRSIVRERLTIRGNLNGAAIHTGRGEAKVKYHFSFKRPLGFDRALVGERIGLTTAGNLYGQATLVELHTGYCPYLS